MISNTYSAFERFYSNADLAENSDCLLYFSWFILSLFELSAVISLPRRKIILKTVVYRVLRRPEQ